MKIIKNVHKESGETVGSGGKGSFCESMIVSP